MAADEAMEVCEGETCRALAHHSSAAAHAANATFNRRLRGRRNAEQAWLRAREVSRLDALASRLRARDDLSVEEVVRLLHGLQHERERILAG